ncbi:unnamed protein product [Cyprideis torosa]|uniref:(d)CMP kinase n=1 Tax=Cyprideis torosa TaxID=163714 RepID=A0A7R8ZW24_9CRUS|nr:unnamed protein product [Cyprideis torosa]CAG0908426.1 unnamed protein product [Cyprideis torosa]
MPDFPPVTGILRSLKMPEIFPELNSKNEYLKKIVVAIDGNSSTGKSSLAKKLAAALGYKHIDSGAMYRCVTLAAMRGEIVGKDHVDEEALYALLPDIVIDFRLNKDQKDCDTFLNGENVEDEIRTLEVSNLVSKVAKLATRKMAKGGGIVMDGRDIGTTVFPNAEVKIFLKASAEKRADRRFKELKEKGEQVEYQAVVENIRERDFLDTTRAISPLTKADDAIEIDNSNLTKEETFDKILELIHSKLASLK